MSTSLLARGASPGAELLAAMSVFANAGEGDVTSYGLLGKPAGTVDTEGCCCGSVFRVLLAAKTAGLAYVFEESGVGNGNEEVKWSALGSIGRRECIAVTMYGQGGQWKSGKPHVKLLESEEEEEEEEKEEEEGEEEQK